MPHGKSDASGAGSAAQFEAQITAKARPLLSKAERKEEARQKAVLQARMAAARAREAAAEHTKKAEAFEAEAERHEKKGD